MNWDFLKISKSFSKDGKGKLLIQGQFGVEKESQRITSSGDLALTQHPTAFGDKTQNPRITADFSESQIEMITPTFKSVDDVFYELNNINNEVENGIGEELLWPLSMPPKLPIEDDIPIAKFADTETGRNLQTYRNGLALRYGKKMQMISGIHYNFSFGDEMLEHLFTEFGYGMDMRTFTDKMHFSLTRNFLRYRWILIYLFGASPFSHPTYHSVIKNEINIIKQSCHDCTDIIENFNQYATSLRVSRFGYSNALKHDYNIYFNSLEEYSTKIRTMLKTKNENYSNLGIYENGLQIQLNENILQKESEFYSSIRLKQSIYKGETQLDALEKRGVNHVEIRILDLNPFEKLGLTIEQMNFLQIFMLFCLFESNDLITEEEYEKINSNHHHVALYGRKEDLNLQKYDGTTSKLNKWGEEIFERLIDIGKIVYKDTGEDKYLKTVKKEYKKLHNISLLPSERIHREMKENKEDFIEFGIKWAINNLEKKII